MHFTSPTDTVVYEVSMIPLVVESFSLRNTVMQYFYDLQNETLTVMITKLKKETN